MRLALTVVVLPMHSPVLIAKPDLGTDELILVPTTSDPDEVDRVADILG